MTESEQIRQNYELGVLAGEARRQAEIIALLEEEAETRLTGKEWDLCGDFTKGLQTAIALIKGENK